MMKKTLAVVLAATVLAGCQTTTRDAYTGEQKTNAATRGAVGGAALAAIVTAATGGDGKNIAVAAAAGGLVGGAIGRNMDKQEALLRQELQSTGVSVIRQGDNITLLMPNSISFAVDGTDLSPEGIKVLNSVSKVALHYPDTDLNIFGHTDSTGRDSYNMRLSQVRADEVMKQLLRHGIPAQRLISKGMGETQPLASNEDEAGRAQNRRVEIVLTPRAA